jgi:hypothetical protein
MFDAEGIAGSPGLANIYLQDGKGCQRDVS